MKRLIITSLICMSVMACACNLSDNSRTTEGHWPANTGGDDANITILPSDPTVAYTFPAWNYERLDVTRSFDIVMCDTIDSILVHVNQKLSKHLSVRMEKGTLSIGLERIRNLSTKGNARCGRILLPYNLKMNSIQLSGTSTFRTALPLRDQSFHVSLSGASRLQGNITANNVELILSGASRLQGNITANNVELILSGSSDMQGHLIAKQVGLDLSGASKYAGSIKCQQLDGELSGASVASIKGKADHLDIDISGSSHLSGADLESDFADLDLSGASKAEVHCNQLIEADLSGVSQLVYSGNARTDFEKSGRSNVSKR